MILNQGENTTTSKLMQGEGPFQEKENGALIQYFSKLK